MRRKLIGQLLIIVMLLAATWTGIGTGAYAANSDAVIEVSQIFTEADAPEGTEVSYVLTAGNADYNMPAGSSDGIYEFKIDGTRDISITIPGFSASGEFTYTLRAVPDTRAKYYFDDKEYKITVYVSGGSAVAKIIDTDNGDKVAKARFNHGYGGADPFISVDPPVRKRIKGTPAQNDTFRFRLKAADAGQPMPDGANNGEKFITVTGAGEEEFGEWIYTEAGTYIYYISEVNTGNPDYEYDTRMYTLTDTVTRENGEFTVQRTIEDSNGRIVQSTIIESADDERAVKLEFENTYIGDKKTDGGGGKKTPAKIIRRIVNTGDPATLAAYIAVIAAVLAGLVILIRRRRRRDE